LAAPQRQEKVKPPRYLKDVRIIEDERRTERFGDVNAAVITMSHTMRSGVHRWPNARAPS
jgi:hypothetical protein